MGLRSAGLFLRAASAFAVLTIVTVGAQAGGFAIREQSAAGQGASFAGVAAGGALSSMYWNPAIITQFKGKYKEMSGAGIIPHSSHSYTASALAALPGFNNAPSNSSESAFVPSSYSSWQINDKIWLGLSSNAPFGLGVNFPHQWAGSPYGQEANIETYNFTPTIAYKVNDWLSIGAGVQLQYMKASYGIFLNPIPNWIGSLDGAGWGFGWTAGITLTPLPKTQIGIGYRSAIDQKINGTLAIPAVGCPASAMCSPFSTPGSVNLTLNLPDMLTVGLRQGIGDRFTLLAGFEWSNWSRIGTSHVLQPNGAPALSRTKVVDLPFEYSDGYFYSLGGEYMVNPDLTLRAGIAYEKSPIVDAVRTPRLPDNDRMWYSAGLSYRPSMFDGLTVDLAYTFIDVKNTPINIVPGQPWYSSSFGSYVGSADSHINIISVGVRYAYDGWLPIPKFAKH